MQWNQISASEKYKSLTPEQQAKVQDGYFNQYVAPKVQQAGFDPEEARTKFRQKIGAATAPAPAPEEKPGFFSNAARLAGERAGDLAGNLARGVKQAGDYLEEKMPAGGFVFDKGYPRYVGAEEYKAQAESKPQMLDQVASAAEDLDLGGESRHNPESVKDQWKQGNYGSAAGEALKFGGESFIQSIPDMAAVIASLPLYVGARATEMGTARAENKGKSEADISDTAEALPFALGSALLERIVPSQMLKGITGKQVQQVGEEVAQAVIPRIAKEAAKGAAKEALTEMFQEGVLEYVGERYGTDAQMSLAEAIEQGAWAALAGSVGGAAMGGVGGIRSPKQPEAQGDESPEDLLQVDPDEQQPTAGLEHNPQRMVTMPDGTTAWESEADQLRDMSAASRHPGFARAETPIMNQTAQDLEQEIGATTQADLSLDDEINALVAEVEGLDRELNPPEAPQIIPGALDRGAELAQVEQMAQGPQILPGAMERPTINPEPVEAPVQSPQDTQALQDLASEQAQAIEAQSPAPTPQAKPKKPAYLRVNPGRDELLTAIAKLGGISQEEAAAQGIDPAHFRDRERVGWNNPFRKNGKTLDEMAEALAQEGYLPQNYSANELLDKISGSLSGRKNYTPQGAEFWAEKERFDEEALRAMEGDDVESLAQLVDPEIKSTPEAEADPAIKALAHLIDDAIEAGASLSRIQEITRDENLTFNQTAGILVALTHEARRAHELQNNQGELAGSDGSRESDTAIEGVTLTGEESSRFLDELFGITDEATVLSSYTEQDLAARQKAEQERQKAEQLAQSKAEQDARLSDFTLTGSDRPADLAAARGQNDLFGIGATRGSVNKAAAEAATSPLNDLPEPTQAQKEAGNYKKGKTRLHGLEISIENPRGSKRSGIDPDGKPWSVEMRDHYGYIRKTTGADGEQVDVFIGPNPESDKVYVVDQINPDGTFDEHKVVMGYDSKLKARAGYRDNYSKGWKVGPITQMSMDEFKAWLRDGDTSKPVNQDHFRDAGKMIGNSKETLTSSPDSSSQAIVDSSAQSNTSQGKPALSSQLADMQLEDLEAMIDEIAAETDAVETSKPRTKRTKTKTDAAGQKRLKKTATRAETTNIQSPAEVERTATEIAKSLGVNLSSGGVNALQGLTKLFGGNGRMNTGISFDEDTYRKAKPHFQAMLTDFEAAGKDLRELIRAMLNAFGDGVKPYILRFAQDLREAANDTNQSNERSGENRQTQDADVQGDIQPEQRIQSGEDARRPVSRDDQIGPSNAVSDRGTAAVRERGTERSEGENAGDGRSDTGSPDTARGPVDSTGGLLAGRDGDGPSGIGVEKAREVETTPKYTPSKSGIKSADKRQIKQQMPFLTDGQVDDVVFAERRLSKPDGYGVLFTNGTGTGKTFTGLGIARRMIDQGKDNIIIVVPKQTIADAWKKAGEKFFNIPIKSLKDKTDNGGKGVVVTTYANFGDNPSLALRNWDAFFLDESHRLSSDQQGSETKALKALRALALKEPANLVRMKNQDIVKKIREINESPGKLTERQSDDLKNLREKLKEAEAAEVARVKEMPSEDMPRAVMLSATPFAYDKNVIYGQGFLFDWGSDKDGHVYNSGNNYEQFMMAHFGYRMRYNRLTMPEAKVDSDLMERSFNAWLKREGVLSGRSLDSDFDYDRRFVSVDSNLGQQIDKAIDWLRSPTDAGIPENLVEGHRKLADAILKRSFNYQARMYLLEAIKADKAKSIIKRHLDLGRKVLVMHDFKKGGVTNPFGDHVLSSLGSKEARQVYGMFADTFPGLTSAFDRLPSPTEGLKAAFPDALVYNGDVSAIDRVEMQNQFNSDESGSPALMIAQGDSMQEGVSVHDTTGNRQRVLLHLGMPGKPTAAIQQEGRIYRTGQASDAVFRYFTIGTNWERYAFASTIAGRAGTAENLAMGEQARGLKQAFIDAYESADAYPPGHDGEGKGGKSQDAAAAKILTRWDMAKSLYFGTKKQGSGRSAKGREGVDYFATPEPIGLKMVELADIRPGDNVLEPSAGHGAIARWFPEVATRRAIEPSADLASRLSLRMDGDVIQDTFENHHISNKYDAIVMNPPFGSGGKTAIEHLAKAYKHLREGGRVVALIPEGPSANKHFDKWIYAEDSKGNLLLNDINLVQEIKLPRSTFERAGTSVSTRIVVIEKWADAILPESLIDLSDAKDIEELFSRAENLTGSQRAKPIPDDIEEEAPPARSERKPKSGAAAASTATQEYSIEQAFDGSNILVTSAPEVSYTTKRGKELRGVLVSMPLDKAKEIDKYSWITTIDGVRGAFVRMPHVKRPSDTAETPLDPDTFRAMKRGATYNERDNKPPSGVPLDKLQKITADFFERYPGARPGISVRLFGDEVQAFGPNLTERDRGKIKGGFNPATGDLVLIAANLDGAADAQATLQHEILVHHGMGFLPEAEITEALNTVKKAILEDRQTNKIWQEVQKTYGDKPVADQLEEVLARIAEKLDTGTWAKTWNNVLLAIRKALAKLGLIKPLTRIDDLKKIIYDFASAFEQGKVPGRRGGGQRQSKSPTVDQTETAAFKKWFGDSKVVDANGKPLVVYHGSPDARFMDGNATFMSLDDRYGRQEGVGAFWFARDRSTAASYADDRRAWDYQNAEPAIIPAYLKLENPLVVNGGGKNWREAQAIGKTTDVIEKAQAEGHDGVIIRNVRDNYNNGPRTSATDTYVVFNSRQIKSATDNVGAFDPDNPNILLNRSPEPRPTAGASPLVDQTETAAFKKWFDKSKVVDENGKPRIMYHGTPADFSMFDKDRVNERYPYSIGFHFTDAKWEANAYTREGIGESGVATIPGANVMPVYLKAENPLIIDTDKPAASMEVDIKRAEIREQLDAAAERGAPYDSVIVRRTNRLPEDAEWDHWNVVVFDPKQIKSAIGNTGAFDPDNPDIRFSRAPNEPRPSAGVSVSERLKSAIPKTKAQKERAQQRAELDPSSRSAYDQLGDKDKTIFQRVRTEIKRQLTPGGLLPKDVFDLKILRDGKMNADERESRVRVGAFKAAVKKAYGKPYEKLDTAIKARINAALRGEDVLVPAAVREQIGFMRDEIKRLSAIHVQQLMDDIKELTRDARRQMAEAREIEGKSGIDPIEQSGDPDAIREYLELMGDENQKFSARGKIAEAKRKAALLKTITENFDTYLHRSYRAFDDPKWPQKVPAKVYAEAVDYLAAGYAGDSAVTEGHLDRARKKVAMILQEGTAFDSMGAFISESKLGAKDLSIIKRRKDIAPEIRALLGEYEDAPVNYTKSVTKMARLVYNHEFLNRMMEIGKAQGFLLEKQNLDLKATRKIAGEASEVYAPLNGLYTYPEFDQALKDALGKENMADWYRAIVAVNGSVKYGKTVLSPTTAMRNFYSAMFFCLANGHFDMTQMRKSVGIMRTYFRDSDDGGKGYMKKLLTLGVIYDSPYASEMMEQLKDSKLEDIESWWNPISKLKAPIDFAQRFYSYGDDFWKIIGFENEKALLMKHKGMSEQQAEKEAAERIRNTYPTYSMTGRFVNSLRRFPLAGTFVSFPAEIVRTSYHITRYMAQDLKDSRAMGMRKLAGYAIAGGAIAGMSALSKAWFNVEDDEEDALKTLAPEWQKNSNFLYWGRDEKGQLRYMDLSFLDPYNYWKRPINAFLRDQDPGEAAIDGVSEMLKPFFGQDILFGAVTEAITNKKQTGARVFNPEDEPVNQILDISKHISKAVQPGFASNIGRMWDASQGTITSSGKKYSMDEELAALAGFRMGTFDPKTALYYQTFGFQDRKRSASMLLTSAMRDPNEKTDDDLRDAYERAMTARDRAFRDMLKVVGAAKKAGMTEMQIRVTLRNSGVSKADSAWLARGEVPPWKPSSAMMRGAIKKAAVLFDEETADEFRRRENFIKQLNRDAQK